MKKAKELIIHCHYNQEGYTLQETIEKNFYIYFQNEYTKIKEKYE